jgi:hypothetical protein
MQMGDFKKLSLELLMIVIIRLFTIIIFNPNQMIV